MNTTRISAQASTDLTWRTSSFSGANNNCVEVAMLPDGGRAVRDSKDSAGRFLRATPAEWAAFLTTIKAGEFDT